MIKPKLSILICTTSARTEVIKPLLATLNHQMSKYPNEVELIINDHETDNVGKKRNDLLKEAKGEWQVSIDSDDMISKDYLDKIMSALKHNTDAVGISGYITTNGRHKRQWHISIDYGEWKIKHRVYLRTPNHISPIRTNLALQAGFPEISHGEDAEFSKRVYPLIKTEVKVKGDIYFYQYRNDSKK